MALLNKKGQSSITDALFFFLIASSLALFLYVFGTNYGNALNLQTEKEQFREYASSALKTILYSSSSRLSNCSLEHCPPSNDPPQEVDFLLAAAKEDFADDGSMDETAQTLKNTVRSIMHPLETSVDYIFFLYFPTQPDNQIPYFLFYKSEFDPANCSNPLLGGCHTFYYCRPNSLAEADNFFFTIPGISQTSAKTRFVQAAPIPNWSAQQVDGEVHFAVWSSTQFPDSPSSSFAGLNCCRPLSTPEKESQCYLEKFQPQTGPRGQVTFLISPKATLSFEPPYPAQPQSISFIVKNLSQSDITDFKIEHDPNICEDAPLTWVSRSFTQPFSLHSKAVLKSQLFSSFDPFKNQGFFVVGRDGQDRSVDSDEAGIRNDYSDVADDFVITLYQIQTIAATVQVPDPRAIPSPCQYTLVYHSPDHREVRNTIQLTIQKK